MSSGVHVMSSVALAMLLLLCASSAHASLAPGMVVGSVSEPLTLGDSTYLIFLPPTWTNTTKHPVLLFLHGVGGINNAKGCRNPGLTTQFPLLDPVYASNVEHIVLVPVAKQKNWLHHFAESMGLVDMALAELGGDPNRVAIAGQSMGAHGAYLYASQLAPGKFCAVIAMCGYLDDKIALGTSTRVPSEVLQPLASTPIWVFHSDLDDEVPPPGQPQDNSDVVVHAFRAAGNSAIKHTRYPTAQKPPNYIAGHAAFELAMHEEALWPWLSAQRLPTPADTLYKAFALALGVSVASLIARLLKMRRLAFAVSSVALLASSVAFLGLMQSEGGILDTCHGYSFLGVSFDKCREIGVAIAAAGEAERGWLALVISKGRAENCFALGMGVGAMYALLFLAKGTTEVAVVHLMHAVWAASVCGVNAQNAGLLPVPAEAGIDPASSAKLVPFVIITGVQALLDLSAFVLTSGFMAKEKVA